MRTKGTSILIVVGGGGLTAEVQKMEMWLRASLITEEGKLHPLLLMWSPLFLGGQSRVRDWFAEGKVEGYLGHPRVECLILGADVMEAEELRVWDNIFAGGWEGGGVVEVVVGVIGLEMDVGGESVPGEGDGDVQEVRGGVGNSPGEFDGGVDDVGDVDELLKLLMGAKGSSDAVINEREKWVRDSAGVVVEGELFHEFYNGHPFG
eukprot:g43735.t1